VATLKKTVVNPIRSREAMPLKNSIAKVGFGRKPALYPARAESRLFDMALKLSKMV